MTSKPGKNDPWHRLAVTPGIELGAPVLAVALDGAEVELGLRLPADYRDFIERFGYAVFRRQTVLGEGRASEFRAALESLRLDLEGRSVDAIPVHAVGNGDWLYLASDIHTYEGQCAVMRWDHELQESWMAAVSFEDWISRALNDPELVLPVALETR